jgi:alpha-tubulin suppressor-like RCC1 family protein
MPVGHTDPLPHIPELAADYDLVRELGRGGTAVVYLARDRELGRDVAVKLIRAAHVQDEDAVARLVREARTVGKLQHPNIVMLLGTRRLEGGGLALILQYVPGRTLKERIREQGPLPFDEVGHVLRNLAEALAYAHRSRIVHRDLKPENVYLDESVGLARLADFGIARAWDSDSGLTLPGTAIGTPSYMSPEQVDGRELDGRSDIYSLGLLGWEMLTGKQPWEGESLYSVIYKQKAEDLPPIREYRPDAPARLVRALEGAMQKQPDDRWKSAEAFLEALGDAGEGAGAGEGAPGTAPEAEAVAAAEGGAPAPKAPPPRLSDEVDLVTPPTPVVPEPDAEPGRIEVPDEPEVDPAEADPARRRFRQLAVGAWALVALVVLAVALGDPDGTVRELLGSLGSRGDAGSALADGSGLPDAEARERARQTLAGAEGSDGAGGADSGSGEGDAGPTPGGASPPGPLVPAQFEPLQGQGQAGVAGEPLPEALVLVLLDAEGRGVPGAPVEFRVTAGGGQVAPAVDQTRNDGSTLARWTLGSTGPQRLEARAAGANGVLATFEATLVESAPVVLENTSDGVQEGTPGDALGDLTRIRVLDAEGRPEAGVVVRFQPMAESGAVSPTTVTTGSDGVAATRWTLGPGAGAQQLVARVQGRPGPELVLEARAVAAGRPVSVPVSAGIRAGGSHSCIVASNGTVTCWGGNDGGQLGEGSGSRRLFPSVPVQGGPFAELAPGVTHTCGVGPDGQVSCWGANDRGQLGREGGAQSTPAAVTAVPPLRALASGLGHSCGLAADGDAWCWGGNAQGQLGDGTTTSRAAAAPVTGGRRFTRIVAGWDHSCAIDAQGRGFCWGQGNSGQLGHGGSGSATEPRQVSTTQSFQAMAAGNAHTCGLTTAARVYCWGGNAYGQLGTGGAPGSPVPVPIASDARFQAVTAGSVHSCALTTEGEALCWGRNLYGQLGEGTTEDRSAPTPVAGGHSFTQLQAMGSHTCGRTRSGETLCWGYNVEGQLGDGSRQNRNTPVRVGGGDG